uniref:Uncharacterized protein n=1 Tax=Arundo donax TaxID=35708 RepID=A0A0A9G8S0_ARUDO
MTSSTVKNQRGLGQHRAGRARERWGTSSRRAQQSRARGERMGGERKWNRDGGSGTAGARRARLKQGRAAGATGASGAFMGRVGLPEGAAAWWLVEYFFRRLCAALCR